MLKWLFPAKIGSFRFYESRLLIIQLDIGVSKAALVKVDKNKIIVENILSKTWEIKNILFAKKHFIEKDFLVSFLKDVFSSFSKFDELWIIVPSHLAVFREISVPFTEREKINKILPFEMEPHLAFKPNEVSIDYLLTSIDLPSTANLMTCMIRDVDFIKLTEIIHEQNYSCNKLVVDFVLIYEILKSSPQYYLSNSKLLFFDIKEYSLTFGFLQNQKLTNLRVFDFGTFDIFETLKKELKLSVEEIVALIKDEVFSSDDQKSLQDKKNIAKKILTNIFREVFFSVEAFLLNSEHGNDLEKLLIFDSTDGKAWQLKDFLSEHFSINIEIFDVPSWFQSSNVDLKKNSQKEAVDFVKLIALASSDELQHFNLGKKLFADADRSIFKKQFILASTLIIGTILFIFVNGFIKISSLNKMLLQKETVLLSELKNILPKENTVSKKTNLKKMLQNAVDLLEKKETIQKSSNYQIPDFLAVYLDLTRLFDRTRFGVVLNNISIKQDVDFGYKINIDGVFNKSKSSLETEDYTTFLRVINLSRRFYVIKVSPEADDSSNEINFSITLGLTKNENFR